MDGGACCVAAWASLGRLWHPKLDCGGSGLPLGSLGLSLASPSSPIGLPLASLSLSLGFILEHVAILGALRLARAPFGHPGLPFCAVRATFWDLWAALGLALAISWRPLASLGPSLGPQKDAPKATVKFTATLGGF